MKRVFKIVWWSVFFVVLLVFAIALAMNWFSVERLTQSIKGDSVQQNTIEQTPDFDSIVDEFLANELWSWEKQNSIDSGQIDSSTGTNVVNDTMTETGAQSTGVSVQDFSWDFVEKDVRSQKDLLLQLRLEHYQAWRKKEFGDMIEVWTWDNEEVHESPTELTEEDKMMLDTLDWNAATEAEMKAEKEAINKGYNDMPDIEFSEGPIGRIEEE